MASPPSHGIASAGQKSPHEARLNNRDQDAIGSARPAEEGPFGHLPALPRATSSTEMDFEDEVEFHVEHLRNHGFTIVKNVSS